MHNLTTAHLKRLKKSIQKGRVSDIIETINRTDLLPRNQMIIGQDLAKLESLQYYLTRYLYPALRRNANPNNQISNSLKNRFKVLTIMSQPLRFLLNIEGANNGGSVSRSSSNSSIEMNNSFAPRYTAANYDPVTQFILQSAVNREKARINRLKGVQHVTVNNNSSPSSSRSSSQAGPSRRASNRSRNRSQAGPSRRVASRSRNRSQAGPSRRVARRSRNGSQANTPIRLLSSSSNSNGFEML